MRKVDNIVIRPNTAVRFYHQVTSYKPGQVGASKQWVKFTAEVGENTLDVFWTDWRGSFGDQALRAMSMGVSDFCTIRMDYQPELYELLRTKEMLVVKDANDDAIIDGAPVRNHPDVYTVWGAVDDVRSMHRIMEFKVRRFEAK